jgi:trigger factor
MDEKYEEIKKTVNLKGFRPGKVPKEVLKRQFGQAIFSEVLDKVLKDTSVKALEDNKIKPAGQPKLDLKTYGEDKDLEYVMSVTELPKVELKSVENIKFDEYSVKIDTKETDKRIKEIAKSQNNFKEVVADVKAVDENLVIFDYKATIDGKDFKGGEGKNTQLILGKDLFIKGFDKQLIGVKKNDEKSVDVTLPENYPQKEYANKNANFICKIVEVKKSEEVKIDDVFAKNLGAKDLADLKVLVTKQINDEYKNSLDKLAKTQILKEIENFKVDEIPENLIEE